MSGTQKPHFAIDLNEIERQLAQAQSGSQAPSSGGRHDPLADLARIVGQDDPFESLLANDPPRGRGGSQDQHDQLFAVRGDVAPDSYSQRREPAPLSFEDQFRQEVQQGAQNQGYQQPAEPEAYDKHAYDQGGYTQDYYEGGSDQNAGSYDDGAYQPSGGRSRKAMMAVGAVLGVVLVGSAGAFMFSGGSAAVNNSEPPLIKATNEPIKVAPQNPGGVEIPNQNKQIYERAQSGETKVVSNSEQPVDVKQAVRMNGGTVNETGSAAPAPAGLNLGEPRKVRTISIKPDGTLARQEPEARTASVAAPPAMTMPAASPPAPAPAPAPAAATPAPAPKPVAATPQAAPSATPAAKPAPVAAAQTPAAAPQRVASAQPTAPAATDTAAEAAIGGFSVQLAVRGSEKDAQAAFSQFQKKYAELAGQQPLIRKAEVNGNTVFRVRAGPMSRDDASSLCSSVQGQGGQCFVAKN